MDPFQQLASESPASAPACPPSHAQPASVQPSAQCFMCELSAGQLDKMPQGPLRLLVYFIKRNLGRLRRDIFYERLDTLYREEYQAVALRDFGQAVPNWPRHMIQAHFEHHVKVPTMVYFTMLEKYGVIQERLWDKTYDAIDDTIDSKSLADSLKVSELLLKVLEKQPADSFLYDSFLEGAEA